MRKLVTRERRIRALPVTLRIGGPVTAIKTVVPKLFTLIAITSDHHLQLTDLVLGEWWLLAYTAKFDTTENIDRRG